VAAAAQPEDEEVTQTGFVQWDITEGWVMAVVAAEGDPVVEDPSTCGVSFGDDRGV
jgi:hypothetical protein